MKKILLLVLLIIFLSLGGFFLLKAKNSKIFPSQAEIGNSAGLIALNSFKGIVDSTFERPVVQLNEEDLPDRGSPFKQSDPEQEKNPTSGENASDLTFAILGDTQSFKAGNPNGNFQKSVANIQKQNPDIVIAVGDLVSNCKGKSDDVQDFTNWKNILGSLFSKTYAVQGNHDRVENGEKCDQLWQNTFNFPANGPAGFSDLTYSLDFKNSHFVFLDSNKPDAHQVNKAQRDWLEKDLAASKKENIFVIFHDPAYPVNSKIEESLDADPTERNALWQILEKHNVTAVYNGHEHLVSRRKIGGIYQFVFGNTDSFNHELPKSGVAEYASQAQGSFGLVKVNGKEITVETYGPNGKLLDTFTFSK